MCTNASILHSSRKMQGINKYCIIKYYYLYISYLNSVVMMSFNFLAISKFSLLLSFEGKALVSLFLRPEFHLEKMRKEINYKPHSDGGVVAPQEL